MKSLAEIERELKQLRQRVRNLENDPEAVNTESTTIPAATPAQQSGEQAERP